MAMEVFWTAVNTISSQSHVHVSTTFQAVLGLEHLILHQKESNFCISSVSSIHRFKTGLRMKRVDNGAFSVSSGVQSANDLKFRA